MTAPHAGDLAFAIDLARRAGGLLSASYEKIVQVDRKSRRDVVTEVDYQSEALVGGALRERFPEDAIRAEESGHHAGGAAAGATAQRRVKAVRGGGVDPPRGTGN